MLRRSLLAALLVCSLAGLAWGQMLLLGVGGASSPVPPPPTCPITPAVVANVDIPAAANGGTSVAINTTGATMILRFPTWGNSTVTPTDSKGNTWTLVKSYNSGFGLFSATYICFPCTVGAGHTFTNGGTAIFGGEQIVAMSNMSYSGQAVDPSDYAAAAGTQAVSLAVGPVTPQRNCEVVIAGAMTNSATTAPTVPAGYTFISSQVSVTFSQASTLAYKIQTNASAETATWTGLSNAGGFGTIAGSGIFVSANAPLAPVWVDLCAGMSVTCVMGQSLIGSLNPAYTGPLIKIWDGSAYHDIGQTAGKLMDMAAIASFCGAPPAAGNPWGLCVLDKFYDPFNSANDISTSQIGTSPPSPNCTANIHACSAPLTIDHTTGLLAIISYSGNGYQYNIGGGNGDTTGVPNGASDLTVLYLGKPVPGSLFNGICCGPYGPSTDFIAAGGYTSFMILLSYNNYHSPFTTCATSTSYCMLIDQETGAFYAETNYSTFLISNSAVFSIQWDSVNGVKTFINGTPGATQTAAQFPLNLQKKFHIMGGGDNSQPTPLIFWGGLVMSGAMSSADLTLFMGKVRTMLPMAAFPS